MFIEEKKSKRWLKKNAPDGAEWATLDGYFYYKVVDNKVLLHQGEDIWIPSMQIPEDLTDETVFYALNKK